MCHDLTKGTLFIDQSKYIKLILKCFEMTGCTPVCIPLEVKTHFEPATPDDHEAMKSLRPLAL